MWNVMSDRLTPEMAAKGWTQEDMFEHGPLLVARCGSEAAARQAVESELAQGADLAYVEWESE